ncbi:MAG: DUF6291 domain-containing protein [Firmicutes bacterium]|nr:DUF6291 domain-containing protein [Bacillota bacterium]
MTNQTTHSSTNETHTETLTNETIIPRDAFAFQREFFDVTADLPPELFKAVITALCNYALNGELSGTETAETNYIIEPLLQNITARNNRYDAAVENGKLGKQFGYLGAAFGKLGGRPKNTPVADAFGPNARPYGLGPNYNEKNPPVKNEQNENPPVNEKENHPENSHENDHSIYTLSQTEQVNTAHDWDDDMQIELAVRKLLFGHTVPTYIVKNGRLIKTRYYPPNFRLLHHYFNGTLNLNPYEKQTTA